MKSSIILILACIYLNSCSSSYIKNSKYVNMNNIPGSENEISNENIELNINNHLDLIQSIANSNQTNIGSKDSIYLSNLEEWKTDIQSKLKNEKDPNELKKIENQVIDKYEEIKNRFN